MRKLIVVLATAASLAGVSLVSTSGNAHASTPPEATCQARPSQVDTIRFEWFDAPPEDRAELESWCRAVGAPLISINTNRTVDHLPTLDELVVVSWNAHLADGALVELIDDLRAGKLTGGRPVEHFVLLVQELYRRGSDVPRFAPDARSAFAIAPRDPRAPDARDYATQLDLSIAYVPSMRNGAEMLEDRGNAILSTEPLHELFAVELPFERQRRVAAGGSIEISTDQGVELLHLVDAHLEPLASASALWIFRNPRRRQVDALLDLLERPRFVDGIGTIVGGDFNTVQGGSREEAYRKLRVWSRSLAHEDPRATHLMGRLDYVFARLNTGWQIKTTRIEDKYGSDHHPVLAQFERAPVGTTYAPQRPQRSQR